MTSAEELASAARAARLSSLLPDIQYEIEKSKGKVEARVMRDLRDGKLSPEAALIAWLEVKAQNDLLRHFETLIKTGGQTDVTNIKIGDE